MLTVVLETLLLHNQRLSAWQPLQTNVSCNGGSNGSASVTPSGAGGYTYSGRHLAERLLLLLVLQLELILQVTDANACTATRNFTITQPTAIDF
jgi:hypothetical protein